MLAKILLDYRYRFNTRTLLVVTRPWCGGSYN